MSRIRNAGAELLKLLKLAADPAAVADQVQVYQKKVSGITQLSARPDNGGVYQLTPAVITDTLVANQNDYAPTNYADATFLEILPSGASRTITGLQGGQLGRVVYIHNPASSGQLLVISGNDSSSAAANRFQTADANTGNASTILRPSAGAAFMYISSRWVEIAKTSGYNIIADNNLTSNGTLTVAGAATVGTIIATTANLSVLTLFGTTTTIAADQDNWTPNSFNISSRVEMVPTGVNRTITGMTGGQASRVALLWNTSTTLTVTLSHQNVASSATNRFLCPDSVDYAVLPGRAVWVVYTGSRWTLMVSHPPASASGGVFVWEAGMPWSTVYAAVNDGKPWIVLVQRDGAFRTITTGAGTNLWNLQFVGIGQAYTGLNIVTIRTTAGFTLGLDTDGFARFQSTNIEWEFTTGGTPIATADPVACSIDGGQLGHTTGDCFVTDTFLCEIKNNARIIGTGGTALVRLTGSTSTVHVTSWGQIGNSSFRTTTGAKTLTINLDWTTRDINGAAFGAGVTPIYPQNQAHAVSPNGTFWTLEVDDTGTLIIS